MNLIQEVDFDKKLAAQKLAETMKIEQEVAEEYVEQAFQKWSNIYCE